MLEKTDVIMLRFQDSQMQTHAGDSLEEHFVQTPTYITKPKTLLIKHVKSFKTGLTVIHGSKSTKNI